MACATCTNLTTATCNNPCGVTQTNTPACESLPSQIQNFTDQFFGVVVKTEVNGEVVWSLPCSLETGLPNNPRGADEGLACYFLRLFRDGIGGLTGPRGLTGAAGTDGTNAYTITTQEFAQPTLNSPLTQIIVVPNPAIVEGLYIFVKNSGTYLVTGVATGGVLFVTLVSPIASPPVQVPSGSIVVPSGPQGVPGPQGPVGPAGPPGVNLTVSNGLYSPLDASGVPHAGVTAFGIPQTIPAVVNFTSEVMEFTPPGAGTYLVNAVVALTAQGTINSSDVITVFLKSSDGIIYGQSTAYVNNMAAGQFLPAVITMIITTSGLLGQTIQVWASTSGVFGSVVVDYQGTMMTWVRIA